MAGLPNIIKNLIGTLSARFQLGGETGPNLKANGSAVEHRNAADSGFVVARGAPAVGDNDFVPYLQLQTYLRNVVVTAQFDGNNALPANTGVEHYYVVTTTGPNASIGDLIWDDGSGSGTATLIAALVGRSMFTTVAFSGGTISLAATTEYHWTGTAWLGDSTADVSGAGRWIKETIGLTATTNSAKLVPVGAMPTSLKVDVKTAYGAGATGIKVFLPAAGAAGADIVFLDTSVDTGFNLQTVVQLDADLLADVSVVTATALRIVLSGTLTLGTVVVALEYTVPDA